MGDKFHEHPRFDISSYGKGQLHPEANSQRQISCSETVRLVVHFRYTELVHWPDLRYYYE